MDVHLKQVLLLSVEEAGDYVFIPSGVVIATGKAKFTLYCASSDHNAYKEALLRLNWEDMFKGAQYKGRWFRLEDVTQQMTERGWTHASAIPDILHYLYESNPRQLFFLRRHLHAT